MPPTAAAGALTDSEVCDARVFNTERAALDIYMMIDASGSMVPWWPGTLEAIDLFLSDPASTGLHVGVQFFGTVCDAAAYATPAVAIAALPGNADALRQAFPIIPTQDTATLPAMQGAIAHARTWAMSHPDHKVVVLLVTDGLPDECGSTVANVSEVAREGFMGSPSIQSFVVGIGDLTALDQFAREGGTGKAFVTAPGAAADLARALDTIRGAALPCEFTLPPRSNDAWALDRVNLRHTPPGGQAVTVGAVADVQRCDAVRGGWYYNDRTAPSRIIACPTTCQQLNAGGEIKVLLGCPTRQITPS